MICMGSRKTILVMELFLPAVTILMMSVCRGPCAQGIYNVNPSFLLGLL